MTAARVSIDDHAAPSGPALAVRGLTRSFGRVRALRGVDFSLDSGEVLAVFGPNGAGKTTLLRILAGLLRPEQGEVIVAGVPLARNDGRYRRRIGMISHHSLLYDGLTARENLEFYGRLYGLEASRAAALKALVAVGLTERATSPVATFSRGMTQRLAIARALLHEPEIVLLDEPFTGLDQQAAAMLRGLLGRLRDDRRAVVLATHNLDEGLELATHVAILVGGRFVECGPKRGDPASYRARYAQATSAGA